MANKKIFYVVWEGHKTGIFNSWNECKSVTDKYPQAKFKSFKTLEDAQHAYSKNYYDFIGKNLNNELLQSELILAGQPILDSLSVDAVYRGSSGLMKYRGVYTKNQKEIYIKENIEGGNENIGEFFAILHGIGMLSEKKSTIPIYSNSTVAINWIKDRKCKTNLEETDNNIRVFNLIRRAEIWLNSNNYVNQILKWETKAWGDIPANFQNK